MTPMTPTTATDTRAARSARTPPPPLAIRALDLVALGVDQVPFGPIVLLVAAGRGRHPDRGQHRSRGRLRERTHLGLPRPDPLLPEVVSLEYAVIAVAVMGVLAFSAEYSTGLIRTTFTAAPRRRAVLAAKAVVLGAVTLAAGELVAFASFFLAQAVLAGHHQGVSLSRPGVPGAVLAAACCCASAPCSAWRSARSSGTPRAGSPPRSP